MVKNRLPLLDYVAGIFDHVKLDDVLVIACQHILETNYSMFECLFEKGLKPRNTFLLGKCYSTNKKVLEKFRRKGVHVHKGSISYDSYVSFDEQFEQQIIDLLAKINKLNLNRYSKILLIDDGGYLVYWGNSLLKDTRNVISIEQTSAGYVKLKNVALKFPVINVARSEAKLTFESPCIAELIVSKLKEKITKLRLNPKKVLVIGKGSIGKFVSDTLTKEFRVKHYDSNESLSDFRKDVLSSIIGEFDLIIGCTGEPALQPEHFGLLRKGTVLVSTSSSDREFSASKLRKLVSRNKTCHKDLKINGVTLINSGFPINFDGGEHSASPEKIQLTRSLILAAVCLGIRSRYPSQLIPLDTFVQQKIISKFEELSKH